MKNILKSIAFIFLISIFIVFFVAPAFSARESSPARNAVEYKIVNNLGHRATISKMDKALDSFTEQQKGKAILEIDLKKFGDEGWELVMYEKDSGFAIFKRLVQ